jgi:heat shock protein HtpX
MNYMKTGILLILLTLLFIWVGEIIGGPGGAWTAFIMAMLMNGISYWFSDKIVLMMYRASEMPKEQYAGLYRLVESLTSGADLPMPRLYLMNNPAANAFATGRDPKHACLCVTTGILQLLDENELKGVLAHELAHVKNRDTLIMTVTATIAGAIMMLANMARWAAIFGGGSSRENRNSENVFGLIAMSIIAPIAAMIVQLAISRSREFGADEKGAYMAKDKDGLASALNKLSQATKYRGLDASPQTAHLFIVNPFRGNFITNLFSTHPPIEARIARLNALKF